MSKFEEDVMQLPGCHRSNVYALLIVKLSCYATERLEDKKIIKSLLSEMKVLFHNHEQRFTVLSFILKQNLAQYKGLSIPLKLFIEEALLSCRSDTLKDYFSKNEGIEKALDCSLQRRFESYLSINMLLNPSPRVWDSVNKISNAIIALLSATIEDSLLEPFLTNLGPSKEAAELPYIDLAFGRFRKPALIDDVIMVLKNQKQLSTIMLVHFMFMRDVYPFLKQRMNLMYIDRYAGDLGQMIGASGKPDLLAFFWNPLASAPHLYTDRGRAEFDLILSNQLGIMSTREERAEFPVSDATWFPDSLCQKADLTSPYVRSLIQQDIPYVAGPSGMSSMLCAALLFLGQWPDKPAQHYYILAMMAFITGGGLHSIHEVLTIPKVRLGLLPAYQTSGLSMGNYNDFFILFHRDELLTQNIHQAWGSTIAWIRQQYPLLSDWCLNRPNVEMLAAHGSSNIKPK